VAQGVGLEFKPQYGKMKKKNFHLGIWSKLHPKLCHLNEIMNAISSQF
jgi:hypothetical protein